MPGKGGRSTENEIAFAVAEYLYEEPGAEALIHEIVEHLRHHFPFTVADQEPSATRPNEQIWEQQVRNITSHRETEGNYIRDGLLEHIPNRLALTDAGAKFVESVKG